MRDLNFYPDICLDFPLTYIELFLCRLDLNDNKFDTPLDTFCFFW